MKVHKRKTHSDIFLFILKSVHKSSVNGNNKIQSIKSTCKRKDNIHDTVYWCSHKPSTFFTVNITHSQYTSWYYNPLLWIQIRSKNLVITIFYYYYFTILFLRLLYVNDKQHAHNNFLSHFTQSYSFLYFSFCQFFRVFFSFPKITQLWVHTTQLHLAEIKTPEIPLGDWRKKTNWIYAEFSKWQKKNIKIFQISSLIETDQNTQMESHTK